MALYLKSHNWSNRAYSDHEELKEAAINAWRTAVFHPDLMKTVCNAPLPQTRSFNAGSG
jgi:hypothetical protein